MATMLTLKEALETNQLRNFVAQAEAAGVEAASQAEFDEIVKRVVKAPPPQGQTSGSRARGGSSGKKTR